MGKIICSQGCTPDSGHMSSPWHSPFLYHPSCQSYTQVHTRSSPPRLTLWAGLGVGSVSGISLGLGPSASLSFWIPAACWFTSLAI